MNRLTIKTFLTVAISMLLAGCVAEAPDTPGQNASQNSDSDTDGKYITLTIGSSPRTRAVGDPLEDQEGTEKECNIGDIKIWLFTPDGSYIYSKQLMKYTGAVVDFKEGYLQNPYKPNGPNGGQIRMKVPESVFTRIKDYADDELQYFAICNTYQAYYADINSKTDITDIETLKNIEWDRIRVNDTYLTSGGYFLMTGTGNFIASPFYEEDDLGTINNPWDITNECGSLEVERLLARFDIHHDVVIDVEELGLGLVCYESEIVNENETGYAFPHYAHITGVTTDFTDLSVVKKGIYTHYHSTQPSPSFPFVATDDIPFGNRTDHNTKTEYCMPFTNTAFARSANYNEVTWILFPMYLYDVPAHAKKAFNAQQPLYAVGGYLIGGAENMRDYTAVENYNVDIAEVHSLYAKAYEMNPTDVDTALKEIAKTNKRLRVFEYKSSNSSAMQHYWVYYFHPIQHLPGPKNVLDHYKKYGVHRNTIYDISINKIKMLGYPDYYVPEKIYDPEEENYIDIDFTVKKWSVVSNTFELE